MFQFSNNFKKCHLSTRGGMSNSFHNWSLYMDAILHFKNEGPSSWTNIHGARNHQESWQREEAANSSHVYDAVSHTDGQLGTAALRGWHTAQG